MAARYPSSFVLPVSAPLFHPGPDVGRPSWMPPDSAGRGERSSDHRQQASSTHTYLRRTIFMLTFMRHTGSRRRRNEESGARPPDAGDQRSPHRKPYGDRCTPARRARHLGRPEPPPCAAGWRSLNTATRPPTGHCWTTSAPCSSVFSGGASVTARISPTPIRTRFSLCTGHGTPTNRRDRSSHGSSQSRATSPPTTAGAGNAADAMSS